MDRPDDPCAEADGTRSRRSGTATNLPPELLLTRGPMNDRVYVGCNYISSPTNAILNQVSAAQWIHEFAYTPESARVRRGDQQRYDGAEEHCRPASDEDVLPTQWHSRKQDDGSGNYVSSLTLATPAKRKRRVERASSLTSVRALTCCSSAQRHTRMVRSRAQDTSACEGSEHGRESGLRRSHAPGLSIRSRRRMVLDAVEIVSKKTSRQVADARIHPTCKTPSSHYPSPPASRAPKEDPGRKSLPDVHVAHQNTVVCDEDASPRSRMLLKTSKYFGPASASPTRSVLQNLPVLTPPSSPVFTIPVYIESSDFEYPPPDGVLNELVDTPGHISTWYNNPSLFNDLMIMLRRLKPILVQETVRDDPWKVLIAVRLLNVTTGKAAIPVFCKIISRWPTPQDLVHAPQDELVELLKPLGLYNKRARWLKDVSQRVLDDRHTPASSRTTLSLLLSGEHTMSAVPHLHYPGVGPYALDSLCIFCSGDKDAWKQVMPRDKELVRYLRWRWAAEEGKMWYPDGMGVIGDLDLPYLITLVDELAAHYDGTIGGEGYMHHFCNDLGEVLGRDS